MILHRLVELGAPRRYPPLIVGVACERAVALRLPHWAAGSHDLAVLCWRRARGCGLCWSCDFEGAGHGYAAERWMSVASSASAVHLGCQLHQNWSSKPTPVSEEDEWEDIFTTFMEVTREVVKKKRKREVLQSLYPGKYILIVLFIDKYYTGS